MKAKCNQDCFHSERAMRYQRDKEYDIDLDNPCAVHFDLPTQERNTVIRFENERRRTAKEKALANKKAKRAGVDILSEIPLQEDSAPAAATS